MLERFYFLCNLPSILYHLTFRYIHSRFHSSSVNDKEIRYNFQARIEFLLEMALLLTPSIKTYPWGKLGPNSLVAQLGVPGLETWNKTPFAELWMGTHPSGPSTITSSGQSLLEYIKSHPDTLGTKVTQKFGPKLPFLFKILSVQTALSIQAHPDKTLAKILHEKDPKNYPDDNHKPEMAIAITPFEVLCGFRDLGSINKFINDVPSFRELVGLNSLTTKEDLKKAFTNLMNSDSTSITAQLEKLIAQENNYTEYELVHRLNKQFPGDIGIFCAFFLQHFTLEPGQAIFLPANEPHAYLSGDCLECMANSDNVVRAGLTPKFKDVETLTQMLTFEIGRDWIVNGQESKNGFLYNPPVDEFAVESFTVDENTDLEIEGKDSCSIGIVLQGSGHIDKNIPIQPGTVVYIPSKTGITIHCSKNLKIYFAYCL